MLPVRDGHVFPDSMMDIFRAGRPKPDVPLLVGTVSYLTGSPRLSILSVIILFAIGAFILRFVSEPTPQPLRP